MLGVLIYLVRVIIMLVFSLKRMLEEQFPRRKRRTDPDLIYQIGNPTLRALSYLHVGIQFEGIQIETINGSGSWLGGTW